MKENNMKIESGLNVNAFECDIISVGTYLNGSADLPKNYLFNTIMILTRLFMGEWKHNVFAECFEAADNADKLWNKNPFNKRKYSKKAQALSKKITTLDDASVIAAVQLVGFIAAQRANEKRVDVLTSYTPSKEAIENIIEMVTRTMYYLKSKGDLRKTWFEFEGVISNRLRQNRGHFLTKNGLWILSTTERPWSKIDVLTIVSHYLMAKCADNIESEKIKEIGIINPRVNVVYRINVQDIPDDLLKRAKNKVKYNC